MTVW
jgi:hypothetical protein|eukprot:CCRYP_008604-RC/>CCRYP_008604-RC protein AED:0.50 eAED:0.50 QI:0/-1/0/1/-1/0/1/0/4